MAVVIPGVPISPCGLNIPVISMGTMPYPPVDAEDTKSAIIAAIEAGYRHFDTAFLYGTERPLGEAIAEALRVGLIKSRDELFITSKLWCSSTERDLILPAIKMSLQNLGLDYLDLYLIHWPLRVKQEIFEAPIPKECIFAMDMKSVWEGMEECQRLGLTRAIGVSNFSSKRLDHLLSFAKIPPAVNQVEMNPIWQQTELREYCRAKGIHITAYSPLGAVGTKWGDNRVMECSVLKDIAKAKAKTTAQVSLRWIYEQGVSLIPKSFNKERMKENLEIFDWALTEAESEKIGHLPQRKGVVLASFMEPHDLAKEIDAEI